MTTKEDPDLLHSAVHPALPLGESGLSVSLPPDASSQGHQHPKPMSAAARVAKFLAERAKLSGLDPEQIAGLNTGHDTREAVLLVSDLRALIDTAWQGEAF